MPRQENDRASFTVKTQLSLEREAEEYADETHRSKSNAMIHLAHVGLNADEEYVSHDAEAVLGSVELLLSVSTEFGGVVDDIEAYADDEFDGVFSRGFRWAVLNGLEAERNGQ